MTTTTMTSKRQIDRHAQLFSWTSYPGLLRETIYMRGDMQVHVQYSKDGSVSRAERYRAVSLKPGSAVPAGVAGSRNKRTTVLSWLAEE